MVAYGNCRISGTTALETECPRYRNENENIIRFPEEKMGAPRETPYSQDLRKATARRVSTERTQSGLIIESVPVRVRPVNLEQGFTDKLMEFVSDSLGNLIDFVRDLPFAQQLRHGDLKGDQSLALGPKKTIAMGVTLNVVILIAAFIGIS